MGTSLVDEVSLFVSLVAPIVEVAAPGASAAISVGTKLLQGVLAAEPTAVALFDQIKSGAPVSDADLQKFAADYEDAYQQLDADISARLANS